MRLSYSHLRDLKSLHFNLLKPYQFIKQHLPHPQSYLLLIWVFQHKYALLFRSQNDSAPPNCWWRIMYGLCCGTQKHTWLPSQLFYDCKVFNEFYAHNQLAQTLSQLYLKVSSSLRRDTKLNKIELPNRIRPEWNKLANFHFPQNKLRYQKVRWQGFLPSDSSLESK